MRFETRAGTDLNHFGVWDAVVNTWRSEQSLDQATAERIATNLNATAGQHGPRPVVEVRRLVPAQPAEARVIADRWRTGKLDVWVREADGWYGHLWFQDGSSGVAAWFRGDQLRPR